MIKQLAVKDALTVKQYATDNGLKVGMATCPTKRTTTTSASGVATTISTVGQDRQCLIAAWGDTDPIFWIPPLHPIRLKTNPALMKMRSIILVHNASLWRHTDDIKLSFHFWLYF